MYPARNTPIKTCSGIIHGLIQPSIVYLKNQRIQNNEHVYMYKYMFKCTDYYMNQSIYMFKAEKAFKYNNVHCASFLIQSILKHSNQCILSSCNISHQVVHTPVSHRQTSNLIH